MLSHRRIVFISIVIAFSFIPGHKTWAQEASANNQQVDSEEEMFGKAERYIQLLSTRRDSEAVAGAEKLLEKILQLYPNTLRRVWVEENLLPLQEIRGTSDLRIAQFYYNKDHGMKGAESRLQKIVQEYPGFLRMDEVLLLLGKVYLKAEQPEAAADYFWKLVCKYPAGKYTVKAFKQLNKIGFDASKGCDNSMP
jgi:outer membrane protein assembly factor BamD (BamD/ComL family)